MHLCVDFHAGPSKEYLIFLYYPGARFVSIPLTKYSTKLTHSFSDECIVNSKEMNHMVEMGKVFFTLSGDVYNYDILGDTSEFYGNSERPHLKVETIYTLGQ